MKNKITISSVVLLILFSFLSSVPAYSQPASAYGFTPISGSFTPITSGTSIAVIGDDVLSPAYNIGFNFNFCGTVYTQFKVSSNGFVTFNTANTNSQLTNSEGNLGTIRPAIMYCWDDLNGTNGTAMYLVTGVAPNRVMTIQLLNWRWNWSSTPASISYQIILYETTNVIDIVYRQEAGAGNPGGSGGATIGICDNTTYLNLNNSSAAPTASSTVFTTNISSRPATGQIYRWAPAGPCDGSTVFPASATTTIYPDTLCTGDHFSAQFNPSGAMPIVTGLTYQWQFSTSITGPWINVGSPTATMTFSNMSTQTGYYRAVVLCQGNPTTFISTPALLTVNGTDPPVTQGNAMRCGPGTVTLTATSQAGTVVNWFDVPTGGIPLDTGTVFVTPFLTSTDTFYASSVSGQSNANIQVGTSTTSTGGSSLVPGPFSIYFTASSIQLLYTADEIIAAGGGAGTINSLAFNCTGLPAYAIPNYTVSIITVPAAMTNLVWQPIASFTQIFNSASYMPTIGWNTINLSTPFAWNGVDNIVIYLCWNDVSAWNSSGNHEFTSVSGKMLYNWADYTGTRCGVTGTTTSTNRPNLKLEIKRGCESERIPVIVSVYEKPDVDLGPDINKCVDPGHLEFLNAANFGATYQWDNNYNGMVRVINGSGTYWVAVTNQYGCTDSDTINVTFKPNPLVDLGNDTTVCNGVTLNLDAGNNGIQYYWSTGQTTPTININNPGTYSVQVTGENGCIKTDSIAISMQGQLPKSGGILVNNLGPYTFSFTCVNPLNIIGYQWSFGDGNYSSQPSPVHTYASVGNYVVTLNLTSVCGFNYDSISTHIYTKIDEIDFSNSSVLIYPNPTKDHAMITCKEGLTMKSIKVINVVGQLIMHHPSDEPQKHQLKLSGMTSGMYTVEIETDLGVISKKLEIVK